MLLLCPFLHPSGINNTSLSADNPTDTQEVLDAQEPRRAVRRSCVQVPARNGNRCMSEGRLHEMNGGAPIESVRGMCVPEPMGRDLDRKTGSERRRFHDSMHLALGQRSSEA